MSIRDLAIPESQSMLEINKMMSGESEKIPDTLYTESALLIKDIEDTFVTLESACKDLNSPIDEELVAKYETLTQESAVTDLFFENWVEVGEKIIEKIIAFIKRLYTNIIDYVKKLFVKFLVIINKQKEIATDILNKKNIDIKNINNINMFVTDTGYISKDLYEKLVGGNDLEKILIALRKFNDKIMLNVPKSEVYDDYVSHSDHTANDIINSYRANVLKEYSDNMGKNYGMDVLNLNYRLLNIEDKINMPFIFASDGVNSELVDVSVDGKLNLFKATIDKPLVVPNINANKTILIEMLTNIKNSDIKKIIENDFKLLDNIKKDSDGYLNQAKRYSTVDSKAMNMYANNMSVFMNIVLRYSVARLSLGRNIMSLFA